MWVLINVFCDQQKNCKIKYVQYLEILNVKFPDQLRVVAVFIYSNLLLAAFWYFTWIRASCKHKTANRNF